MTSEQKAHLSRMAVAWENLSHHIKAEEFEDADRWLELINSAYADLKRNDFL